MSDYFEMSCYNHIVDFYELNGFEVSVENLQDEKYRYKCSTSGIQSNFSYFKLSKKLKKKVYEYELQHNLAVESSYSKFIFTTPDICVIKKGKIKETKEYYDINRTFCYVENKDLMSFIEVKQFNPFPELLFNFIGVVNELRKDVMNQKDKKTKPSQIAPSLMLSGKPNKPAERIIEELESRYCINIISDVFNSGSEIFSKGKFLELRVAGETSSS